ncbi:MAG: MBL fold metallo-hydrolase, partial [Pseudomonadota bacterium]
YWHGNGYFKALGATIVAHKEADRVMREMGAGQLESNKTLLKEKAEGTVLAYPMETFDGRRELKLGKTTVQLLHFGPAHTPGDIAVWLPVQKILFAGDIVYTERMLAIIPLSHTGGWVQAFDKLVALKPRVVVPGHGKPTDLKRAKKETRDYLTTVRASVKKVLDDGGSLQDAVEKTNQSKFKYLENFELLAGRNVNQTYLEMEKDAF